MPHFNDGIFVSHTLDNLQMFLINDTKFLLVCKTSYTLDATIRPANLMPFVALCLPFCQSLMSVIGNLRFSNFSLTIKFNSFSLRFKIFFECRFRREFGNFARSCGL